MVTTIVCSKYAYALVRLSQTECWRITNWWHHTNWCHTVLRVHPGHERLWVFSIVPQLSHIWRMVTAHWLYYVWIVHYHSLHRVYGVCSGLLGSEFATKKQTTSGFILHGPAWCLHAHSAMYLVRFYDANKNISRHTILQERIRILLSRSLTLLTLCCVCSTS